VDFKGDVTTVLIVKNVIHTNISAVLGVNGGGIYIYRNRILLSQTCDTVERGMDCLPS
jgi:hypothetical protein